MVHGAASGHPGGSLGCADFFKLLYFKITQHNPRFIMDGKNEDLFFLSNGHISPFSTPPWQDQDILSSKNYQLFVKSTPVSRVTRQPMNIFRVSESHTVRLDRA